MSDYLREAAELLRRSSESNEQCHKRYPATLNEGRERIAAQFAELAAIERGILPSSLARELLSRDAQE